MCWWVVVTKLLYIFRSKKEQLLKCRPGYAYAVLSGHSFLTTDAIAVHFNESGQIETIVPLSGRPTVLLANVIQYSNLIR